MPEVQADLAWAAGVLDYGGYVKEKNRTLYLRVKFPYDRGQGMRFKEVISAGKLYGPYRLERGLIWRYELTGRANISRVIGRLRSYLTQPSRFDGLVIEEVPSREASADLGFPLILIEEAQTASPTVRGEPTNGDGGSAEQVSLQS